MATDFVSDRRIKRVAHLYVLRPGTRCQLTLDLEFSELSEVIGVLDTPGAQPVPNGKGDVVLVADVQDFVPITVRGRQRRGFETNYEPGRGHH